MGSMAIGVVEFKSFFLPGRHWDPGTRAGGGDVTSICVFPPSTTSTEFCLSKLSICRIGDNPFEFCPRLSSSWPPSLAGAAGLMKSGVEDFKFGKCPLENLQHLVPHLLKST